ncbi:hypothetical protein PEDI_22170 [Persicobacter diffluens]|uniref:Uncharacterized protein n=2 Tax=Persicobacter diffluens TaxID=981 RepID=A0AAN4VZH1_9BACT|nr:hypothetical protein PEDI_22170 [Persicobacter diffluens]
MFCGFHQFNRKTIIALTFKSDGDYANNQYPILAMKMLASVSDKQLEKLLAELFFSLKIEQPKRYREEISVFEAGFKQWQNLPDDRYYTSKKRNTELIKSNLEAKIQEGLKEFTLRHNLSYTLPSILPKGYPLVQLLANLKSKLRAKQGNLQFPDDLQSLMEQLYDLLVAMELSKQIREETQAMRENFKLQLLAFFEKEHRHLKKRAG